MSWISKNVRLDRMLTWRHLATNLMSRHRLRLPSETLSGSPLDAARNAFEGIYRDDIWALRSAEYGSQKSGLETEAARNRRFSIMIQDLIRLNDVKSVVEFGCGWWKYAADVDWTGVNYDGYDIVESVVEDNERSHARENIRFHLVTKDLRIPRADMLISKDVFQHLPIADIQYYMSLFRTNFRFMLIANDGQPEGGVNDEIVPGGYRALRLELSPFNIPNTIIQQWQCLEFGNFIVKNFCLVQGEQALGSADGIILHNV